jgi:hypothetical protein
VWVKGLRRFWLLRLELLGIGLMILAFIALIVGRSGHELWTVGVCLLVASFVVTMLQHFLVYTLIRCPACGYNPTRTLAGKKMSIKSVTTRLARYERCPRCEGAPLDGDEP